MNVNINRLLVLAPHTDDAELGCGGAIARFLDNGVEITVAAFSSAEESLPAGARPSMLREEFVEAMRILGVPTAGIIVYDFPVRRLMQYRQEVLENLICLRRDLEPELVFAPASTDLHQDHQTLHAESLRAFKDLSVWGYELPWNHIDFSANGFITLKRSHLDRKWQALSAYRSQVEMKRPYFSFEFIEGLARVRGVQVKAQYAEAFEVFRLKL